MYIYYLLRLSISNANRSNQRKWSYTKKKGKKQTMSCSTMTVANYADDLMLLIKTLALAEFLLHSLEQAAGGIDLYMNANKRVFMF